jgi:hypothetical protein
LILESALDEAAVRYQQPGVMPPARIAFSAEALSAIEGPGNDPITVQEVEAGKGVARWSEGGVARTAPLVTNPPETVSFPTLPRKLISPGEGFQTALCEAVQTAARDCAHLALSRLMLRGSTGEIVATDGRQLFVQSGFAFPWKEDLLVPALPAFTGRGFPADASVGLGRTTTHVAVGIERWLFLLTSDTSSRFPDYHRVVPSRSTASALGLALMEQ